MDIQKLHSRSITASVNCYAQVKPVQACYRVVSSARCQLKRRVLVSRCSAGEASDAAPQRHDVGRMFQQHKVLMEAGFSYDQASLILEITERRAAPQPASAASGQGMKGQDVGNASPQPAPAAAANSSSDTTTNSSSSSSSAPAAHSPTDPRQQQLEQQQPGLKGFEDRLSFLELELLKLTLQPDAQLQLLQDPAAAAAARLPPALSAGRGSTAAAAKAAAGLSDPEALGWPGFVTAADIQNGRPGSQAGVGLISQPELLDPEVLAIAEALLIRKGLPYSAAAFAAPSGAAAQQSQYPQQQQQQQGRMRTPSSIWGRRRAAQQLRAKPWRYADDPAAAAAAAAAGTQGLIPYGYQPNIDAGLLRSRGPNSSSSSSGKGVRALPAGIPGPDGFYGNYPAGYGSGFDPRFDPGYPAGYEQGYNDGLMGVENSAVGNDLTPYEPSGWAVAGTVLVVYAGVLLTFFALLAGAGDVGAAVDPADVMLWW